MTEYNVEVEVPSGRHIRNVKVESLATSWFLRCTGVAVVIFAVAIFVSFRFFSLPHSIDPLVVVTGAWTILLGPATGTTLILLPWVFKESDLATKRVSKRMLLVVALDLVIAAASMTEIILTIKLT